MDSSLGFSKESIPPPPGPPVPYNVPSLREILLRELYRHRSKISSLDACSVEDASPVLQKLGFEQLLTIESNTKRDLKEDPFWDDLWEIQCTRLSIPQAKGKTWRETWTIAESKRKKYACPKPVTDPKNAPRLMTEHQVGIIRAKEDWRRKVNATVPLDSGLPMKKSKYK